MFYITKYNFCKNFVGKLDLDIPALEKEGFFKNYKLDLFDLDLNYFTKNEREVLVISDRLYRDISNINRGIVFRQIKCEQQNWVYKISVPTYHSEKTCDNLNTEFNNIRIPNSLASLQSEEYRQFFLDNKDRYGFKAGLVEPKAFARKLKEKFGLTESIDDLLNNHILPTIRENSGVESVTGTVEQSIDEINKLIDAFKDFVKKEQISDSFSRCSWMGTKADAQLSEKENQIMGSVYNQKKIIVSRILTFHFQHIEKKGFDVSEYLLEMLGFQACPNCCKHIVPF